MRLFKRGRPLFQDVVSSRRRAGYLGMGRTGDSLVCEFPPRSGGGSPLRGELLGGRKTGCPVGKMVVVVVVVVVVAVVES